MHDSELKKLLLETCPVKPGQEGRAWTMLRDHLYAGKRNRFAWSWLFYPTRRGLALAAVLLALVSMAGHYGMGAPEPVSLATADSQAPGIYATAFYSRPAQAQVVWLNGMDPATDKPTYLDPTSVIGESKDTAHPAGDPNSL
jgi:hypothetical protein